MTKGFRDGVLFFSGLTGVAYCTVVGPPDPGYLAPLLVLFATMMGLPAFLRRDEKSQNDD